MNINCNASLAVVLVAASLCACTAYAPTRFAPGATIADVTQAMGRPTGEYQLPGSGNKRLEFARGPFGKHTYMLDFDASGRMVSSQQVLSENNFNALRTGTSRDDLLMSLGHPSDVKTLPYQHRLLWSYRYEGPFCQWFQVGLDARGQVVDTGYGPDPMCTERHPLSGL